MRTHSKLHETLLKNSFNTEIPSIAPQPGLQAQWLSARYWKRMSQMEKDQAAKGLVATGYGSLPNQHAAETC